MRPGRRILSFGVPLMCVGAMAIGYAGYRARPVFGSLLFSPAHPVPGDYRQQLDEGSYLISVQSWAQPRAGPGSVWRKQSNTVLKIVVADPNGVKVPLGIGRNQSVQRNDKSWAGVVVSVAEEAGTYEFHVLTSPETNALVTLSLHTSFVAASFTGFAGGVAAPTTGQT